MTLKTVARRGVHVIFSLSLLAVASTSLTAQEQRPSVRIGYAGPGRPTQIVREVLRQPYDVRLGGPARITFPRDTVLSRSLIVLGGDAEIAAVVHGDVLVIDGDLFVHPGATIDGRAIAIGGCVYPSALSTIRRGQDCFRDVTFDVVEVRGDYVLDYREIELTDARRLYLPSLYGVRIPEYNRVDGLALPFGPTFNFDSGRITGNALATYRTNRGALDFSLSGRANLNRTLWADAVAERSTVSNDRWIYSNLVNSASSFVFGKDTRNYYRADRFTGRAGMDWETSTLQANVWGGARTERAWSAVGGAPWSLFNKTDSAEGMRRPNPPIERGRISSALAGGRAEWSNQRVEITFSVQLEVPFDTPADGDFTQTTLDATADFPTFGAQSFELESHGVLTTGDDTPPQRFAYLGGSGTLPTLDLLEMGGDQLVFVESRYNVPIQRITIPFVGSPIVTLRHMIGAAGVDELPDLVQNLGLRLTLRPLRFDAVINPSAEGDEDKSKFSVGVSFGR
ncbi:MAG: hypothetical protein ACR2G6_04455 [Gemmatimonadaceae bacterium]